MTAPRHLACDGRQMPVGRRPAAERVGKTPERSSGPVNLLVRVAERGEFVLRAPLEVEGNVHEQDID